MADDSWKDELNVPYRVHEELLIKHWAERDKAAKWRVWFYWAAFVAWLPIINIALTWALKYLELWP